MATVIEAKPSAAALAALQSTAVYSGDHMIVTRKGDSVRRRSTLQAMLKRMDELQYNPSVETAAESLEALRNRV